MLKRAYHNKATQAILSAADKQVVEANMGKRKVEAELAASMELTRRYKLAMFSVLACLIGLAIVNILGALK